MMKRLAALLDPRRLLVLPAAVMVASGMTLYAFTAEDAYIVARYAENLVQYGALHFNLGEPINALTSPLHALVEAALFALTGSSVAAYKMVGLLSFLATIGLVLAALRGKPQAQAAALVVLAAPCIMLWTVGGLETPLLMLAATSLTVLSVRPGRLSAGQLYLAGLLAALAVLTRYDAVLFAGPVVLALLLRGRSRRHALGAAVLGAALFGSWLAFAWTYFGDVMPTSYYVKTPSADRWLVNAWYVAQYLVFTGVGPLLLLALLWKRTGERASQVHRTGLYIGLSIVLLYALTAATTHMMFGFRLIVPYLPALGLLAAETMARRWVPDRPARTVALGLALVALTGFQGFQLSVTYTTSVNGLARGFEPMVVGTAPVREGKGVEYERESARSYTQGFMAVLERQAEDIRAHWAEHGTARAPRVHTYAAGMLPYTLREAYVFEALVSHRRGCDYPYSRALSSDYIHILSPRHGAEDFQLPLDDARYVLVSAYTIPFDGRPERFAVYYNPRPLDNPLPNALHAPCPTDEVPDLHALMAAD